MTEPIYARLRALASQENCDGEPYDTMIEAADRLAQIERQVRKLADAKEASASKLHDEGCELLASDEYEDADRLRAIIGAPEGESDE